MSAPIQVAFLTDAPRVAGSEVWLLDVLPRLAALGVQPSVFLPHGEALDELAARFRAAGVSAERYSDPATLPERTRAFDLRALQVWDPATYRLWLPRLAAPRLVVIHDQLDYHYPLGLKALYRQIYRRTKADSLRAADRLLTVSVWGGEFLRGVMALPDVGVVRNGMDTEKFRPADAEERAVLREALGWTRFTVLVPGRFALEKNQLAAVLAARHAPELDFVFVGDMDSALGQVAQQLRRTLRLGNVHFLGRRWDMPELYRAADALLQPTLAENQSLVTLEAMSSGLPVVTTHIPAQAELVEHGVTGLLVPPQPSLLVLALTRLAANPERAQALGQAARQHVLSAHTLDGTAQQVAQVLLETVRASGRP